MFDSMLRRLLVPVAGLLLFGASGAAAVTITVTEAHISGDFSTINVSSDIADFTDTGDIASQFAILGLQNAANGEEAISFALLTGYPSTGQSTPDHPVPPPPGVGGRIITIVSAIVDHTLDTFTLQGVLQGDWTVTQASDFTVIVGLQTINNGEEAITFSDNVTISAPSAVGVVALALFVLTTAGTGGARRQNISS